VSDSRALLSEAARRLAAAGVDNPRLDARLLWEHAENQPAFESFVTRRCGREPLAYITGHKEFWSLDFEVGPGVLVPRPETETIIEQAIALLPDRSAPLRLLDLGTGSGCLLVAFLKEFPNSRGLGVDASEKARAYATANVNHHRLTDRAEIRPGNWGEEIEGGWDVILSNPPYIRTADIAGLAPEVRFEPTEALDGGLDGLGSIRLLAAAMARLLGGVGLTEIGAGQAAEAAIAMGDAGLVVVRTAADLAGIPRVLVTRPPG
jgi:release factor glutamine methyltransferase